MIKSTCVPLIFIIFLLYLSGCCTYQKCYDKYGLKPQITIKDTIVYIPQSIKDTVFYGIDTLTIYDTLKLENERLKVELVYAKDTFYQNKYIYLKATAKPDTIKITKTEYVYMMQEPQPKKQLSFKEKMIEIAGYTALTIGLIIFILLLLKIII